MKNGKWKIILFLPLILNAFKVEFTKVYKEYVIPKKDAIFIQTKVNNLTFPFHFFKTKNGYILYGNLQEINNYLDNDFYAPNDAKFKNIKIAIVDMDKIQQKVINKIKKTYKNCKIKDIIFLNPDEEKIIVKPTFIKEKYKVILECK